MPSNNRTCLCCSKKYSYCPSCLGADRLAPSWKSEFCSETCKDLWLTCTRFNMGTLTRQQAQDIIKSLYIKPLSEYVACIQKDIKTIQEEKPKLKRGKRTQIQPIDDFAGIDPNSVEESHEVVKQENE